MTTRNLRRCPASPLFRFMAMAPMLPLRRAGGKRVAKRMRARVGRRTAPLALFATAYRSSRPATKPITSLTPAIVFSAMARGAVGAVDQHLVDMAGVGQQAAHLAGDRRELLDGEVGERRLEGRELRAAMLAQHLRLATSRRAPHRCRRGCRLPGDALRPSIAEGSGSGSVFALRSFSAIVSASSVRLMRE